MAGPAGNVEHLFVAPEPEKGGHVTGAIWEKTQGLLVVTPGDGVEGFFEHSRALQFIHVSTLPFPYFIVQRRRGFPT
jgi:hypothetical protein